MGTETVYEVSAKCRFSHILTKKPLSMWYNNYDYLIIAESELEAEKLVKEKVEKKFSRRVSKRKFREGFLEINITEIKKAAPIKNTSQYIIPDRYVVYDKDGESSLTDIKNALAERNNRNLDFNRSKMSDKEFDDYIGSVANEILLRLDTIKRNIFEIGRLLYDAKDLIDHGDFENWVGDTLQMGIRTAENYINVYKHCMCTPELVNFFKPSILYQVCSPNFPKVLREELFSNATGEYDYKFKDFLAVVVKYKRGEITLESDEIKALLNKKRNCALKSRYIAELEGALRGVKKRFDVIKGLNRNGPPSPVEITSDDYLGKLYEKIEKQFYDFIKNITGDVINLN